MIHTCQIIEVWILMEVVEDIAGAIFDVCRSYDGDCLVRQLGCQLGSAVCIFRGGDARSD